MMVQTQKQLNSSEYELWPQNEKLMQKQQQHLPIKTNPTPS